MCVCVTFGLQKKKKHNYLCCRLNCKKKIMGLSESNK